MERVDDEVEFHTSHQNHMFQEPSRTSMIFDYCASYLEYIAMLHRLRYSCGITIQVRVRGEIILENTVRLLLR